MIKKKPNADLSIPKQTLNPPLPQDVSQLQFGEGGFHTPTRDMLHAPTCDRLNELTLFILTETAMKNKAAARRNDNDFKWLVINQHWNYLIDWFGVPIKEIYLSALAEIYPSFFDEDGFITPLADKVFNLDIWLSNETVYMVEKIHEQIPGLQLITDWGDLPAEIVKPFMKPEKPRKKKHPKKTTAKKPVKKSPPKATQLNLFDS